MNKTLLLTTLVLSPMLAPPLQAQSWSPVDESFFCGPAVAGEDTVMLDCPVRVGFDRFLDGTPIDTPVDTGTGVFHGGPATLFFAPIGLVLGLNDTALSQPSKDGAGIGVISRDNVLGSQPDPNWNSKTEFFFVDPATNGPLPTTAAGLWVGDGPTNDCQLEFYDAGGNLIATLSAAPTPSRQFLGIQSQDGIARIEVTTTAGDDYFIEDLSYIAMVGDPGCDRSAQLCLIASPRFPYQGEDVDLTTRFGTAGKLSLLAVIDLAGSPTFFKLGPLALLDNNGERRISGPLPVDPALTGLTLTLQSLALDANNKIQQSNPEPMELR